MKLYSSLWNADDWATRGGLEKTNWANAPFIASYRGFHIDGCQASVEAKYCATQGRMWWDQNEFRDLDAEQYRRLKWVRMKWTIYNYCTDRTRFPVMPAECKRDRDVWVLLRVSNFQWTGYHASVQKIAIKYVCLLVRYVYALFGPEFMLLFYCLAMFLISSKKRAMFLVCYVIYKTYKSFVGIYSFFLASTNLFLVVKCALRYNIILVSIIFTHQIRYCVANETFFFSFGHLEYFIDQQR